MAMTTAQAVSTIRACYEARRPLMLFGAPGIGKSAIVKAAASDAGLNLIDIRVIMLDPVDLRGIPTVVDGRTAWAPPAFLPMGGAGILFLDELSAAPASLQAACYQLILDRRLGEYELPAAWSVVAAGNRQADRAVASRLSTALRSRFVGIELEPSLPDWRAWAMASGRIRSEVIGFLGFRPGLLMDFDPRTMSAESAFACPRTWEYASDMLSAGFDPALELEVLSGTIGRAAASELAGFLRVYRTLPPIDSILADPASAPVPADPSTLYAIAAGLAYRAAADTIAPILAYAGRLPAEYAVLLGRDAVSKYPAGQRTAAFVSWAARFSEVIV